METIINCFLYSKSVCLDMMESNLAMLRFVAAPNAVMKGKKEDKDGNLGVNQTLAAIQANVASAPTPPPVRPPGSAPATIGPQQHMGGGQTMTYPQPPTTDSFAPNRTPTNNFQFVTGMRPDYRSGRVGSFTNPFRKLDPTETSNSGPTVRPVTAGITGAIPPASSDAALSRPRKRARDEDEQEETEPDNQGEGEGQEEGDRQGEK
jgi:hypothetical protein